MIHRLILGCAAMLVMAPSLSHAACSPATHGQHTSTDIREIAWMDKGVQEVKNKLKDEKSARFKNVYFCRGARNIPMTCGYVNSKNSFGAYGGFERFVSAGRPDLTYLESEVSGGFGKVWTGFCK